MQVKDFLKHGWSKHILSRGLVSPEVIVSDNGTQLTSSKFSEFCSTTGIAHLRTPPYHPQSNAQVEKFVDTVKRYIFKYPRERHLDNVDPFLSTNSNVSSSKCLLERNNVV
ncbi:hypothetical protein AHF37_12699 [Paragonimus kellicotti]|nr:hypothetical protein AHF37_12699 [Paragonimus kellicotti]